MVIKTPWQFGDRTVKEENNNGVVLPKVPVVHPMSRLGDVGELSLRGSCVSVNNGSVQNGKQSDSPRGSGSPHAVSSVANVPNGVDAPRPTFLPNIPKGVEVKVAEDRNKVHIPVFGNNTGLSSRIENRLAVIPSHSVDDKTKSREKPTASQIEKTLREKIKTGYFSVKSLFQSYDPENRGTVNREQLLRILSTFLATNISLSQFNRLMKCLELEKSNVITFDEFYQHFKAKKEVGGEYPSWFFQDKSDENNCTANKVHTYLKNEASKNSDDLLISLNILTDDENIIKPELHKTLKKLGYEIGPAEYEKLWTKYDESGTGVVEAKKFVEKLTRKRKPEEAEASKKKSKDYLREQSINIERWLTKKFRVGFHEMQHAFKEVEVDGLVSRDQFLRVLKEYGLFLKDKQLDTFLERCSVPNGRHIDYNIFLTMFQNRGANGLPSKILHNQHHNYNRATSVASCVTNVSDIECILMDMFHADFMILLNKFQKIDHSGKGAISAIEFRACLESYFGIELLDVHFAELLKTIPKDGNGNVNYQEFLARFDSNSSKTIFDSVSSLGDVDDRFYFGRALSTCSLTSRQSLFSPGSVSGEKDVTQLSAMIKEKLRNDFQGIENAFYELDVKNTKRMSKEIFHKILTTAVPDMTSKETDALWKHILTDQGGSLEFTQFVRHFGFSMKSAVYPNSKRNPPVRGDQDFRILSHRFNSSKELIEDLFKNSVEQRYDEVWKIFQDIDKTKSNYVDEDEFKKVLTVLCPDFTADEQITLTEKYSTGKRIAWKKFMAKLGPRHVVRTSTDVIMHTSFEEQS